ncbi:hypothetical protein [Pseudomonas pseudonitroreducens]|uniref:hypothetical protein n=1 Tax=Pseudomonas pseudonitroreducens TaxID=2892326 RepID=UPI001F3DFE06|nr:hypothetical protein [Pseudomonas pseudonitroreducens]
MRGFGIFILIVGAIAVVASMAMDTTVGTLTGRVNNIGLIAQQQMFMMGSGLVVICGLLMTIFGKRNPIPQAVQTRACPFCAEAISPAAIKCKHCGSEVEPAAAEPKVALSDGWIVSIPCRPGDDLLRTLAKLKELDVPVLPSESSVISAGPYAKKDEAGDLLRVLSMKHRIHGNIEFLKD